MSHIAVYVCRNEAAISSPHSSDSVVRMHARVANKFNAVIHCFVHVSFCTVRFQQSDSMVVPGSVHFFINGIRVAAFRSSTVTKNTLEDLSHAQSPPKPTLHLRVSLCWISFSRICFHLSLLLFLVRQFFCIRPQLLGSILPYRSWRNPFAGILGGHFEMLVNKHGHLVKPLWHKCGIRGGRMVFSQTSLKRKWRTNEVRVPGTILHLTSMSLRSVTSSKLSLGLTSPCMSSRCVSC